MLSAAQQTLWNPGDYLNFASERTQPFIDLLSRLQLPDVRRIVDLGCGPGNGMPVLRALWPQAEILGVDSSEQMLQQAARTTASDTGITYLHADIRDLQLDEPADLIVSNAALQWIPEHRQVLPRIQQFVADGGALAVQLPGNFSAPSHRLLAEFAGAEPYRAHIDPHSLLQPTAEVSDYMLDVAGEGWDVTGWETRYHHVLSGEDPVFDWIASAGARPVLQALPEPLLSRFVREYKAALRQAYPPTEIGTILPFRRLFFIAARTG
ncbi:methyltransferase domain-containing protein [Nesterenkonia sp.]|uniref:methyltransferase domain-containing protein n=1 Tax=Nesterenkonia sp. TaxID=704201 RepID=UPI002639ECAB|nr:methyltransferase domain-containing protein [Nesterenkonia sp.]